jgi:hypothetical protein
MEGTMVGVEQANLKPGVRENDFDSELHIHGLRRLKAGDAHVELSGERSETRIAIEVGLRPKESATSMKCGVRGANLVLNSLTMDVTEILNVVDKNGLV